VSAHSGEGPRVATLRLRRRGCENTLRASTDARRLASGLVTHYEETNMNNRLERIDAHLFQEMDDSSSRQVIGGLGATFTATQSVTVSLGQLDSETDVTIDASL
jgi:hypothetical protein